ncbi:hypothetical protein KI688_010881 [Linnemannia hyalina]|uniref:HCP-like protein n=1 Tax=Linnemannia hyalina TaxID=64524 RepID=A0A9P8BUE4_9FUNG|nr:hypothetical protein KI688_010881 [Linnemannia hyalina]
MNWYLMSAEQEYATAQYQIGHLYYHGHGVPQDCVRAMEWYLKAAEGGYTESQFSIGELYYFARDYAQVMDWYLKAANQGDTFAQNSIGVLHYRSRSVSQDCTQAMDWFLKAAKQRYGDHTKVAKWFSKAADRGNNAKRELEAFKNKGVADANESPTFGASKESAAWVETKQETWKLLLPLLDKIITLERKRPIRPTICSKVQHLKSSALERKTTIAWDMYEVQFISEFFDGRTSITGARLDGVVEVGHFDRHCDDDAYEVQSAMPLEAWLNLVKGSMEQFKHRAVEDRLKSADLVVNELTDFVNWQIDTMDPDAFL